MLLNSMSGLSMCLEQVSRKAWRLSIYHSSCAAWRTTGLKNVEEKKRIAFLLRRSMFFRQRSHTADYISAHFCRLQTHLSLFLKWPNKDSSQLFPPFCVTHTDPKVKMTSYNLQGQQLTVQQVIKTFCHENRKD